MDSSIGSLIGIKAAGATIELLGKENVNGSPAYQLNVAVKSAVSSTCFLDVESSRPYLPSQVRFRDSGRSQAMAFFGIGVVVAPILGPVLGGWLTDTYSWRWVFFVNIPFGLLSLFLTASHIFDPPWSKRSFRSSLSCAATHPVTHEKNKSSHGYHESLSFRNGVVHEIFVIREIRGCFVKTKVIFSEQCVTA